MKSLLLLVSTLLSWLSPQQLTYPREFVGSAKCQQCHQQQYADWSKTLMANVVRDPKTHPDAIIPDLSKPDPLLTFTKDDIAFVYGSKWKQRYFTKRGADYYPLGAQWDVTHKIWRRYFVAENTDWWVPHYPADNLQRPTGPTCDGCHSVNYNVRSRIPTEWNVGCEKCHGPGSQHVAKPDRTNIVNPSRLEPMRSNDVCIQCHSQGQPTRNPIDGRYFDWPVGYDPTKSLTDFWHLDPPELGKQDFLYFADGTAHKNRMQGNDFVTSRMYLKGVRCQDCHDAHGSPNNAMLRRPVDQICSSCHSPGGRNGPQQPTLQAHTHHAPGSEGSLCVNCHMPKIEQTIADVNVRSHTFRFISPGASERLKVPNACTTCHTDKANQWAIDVMKTWASVSPWRIGPL
ncbi:MAG TPA: cytochrome c3 family protein [Vicinamibacterales bacterium]|nr:cytochrome c3 family protein [Vicinamibacterales bacterium]